ncbi:hypothetical protein JCM5350_002121 [Sporobolomyces pararoseus]
MRFSREASDSLSLFSPLTFNSSTLIHPPRVTNSIRDTHTNTQNQLPPPIKQLFIMVENDLAAVGHSPSSKEQSNKSKSSASSPSVSMALCFPFDRQEFIDESKGKQRAIET